MYVQQRRAHRLVYLEEEALGEKRKPQEVVGTKEVVSHDARARAFSCPEPVRSYA